MGQITVQLAAEKTVLLRNWQVAGQNQIKLTIEFVELKRTIEYTIDVGEVPGWLANNPGKTWKHWAKGWLLNLYDRYALAQQMKKTLDEEATT